MRARYAHVFDLAVYALMIFLVASIERSLS